MNYLPMHLCPNQLMYLNKIKLELQKKQAEERAAAAEAAAAAAAEAEAEKEAAAAAAAQEVTPRCNIETIHIKRHECLLSRDCAAEI